MGKPSIFSKDYKIKMKKRRQRNFMFFLLIFFVVNGYLYFKLNINFNVLSVKNYIISIVNKKAGNNNSNNNKVAKSEIDENESLKTDTSQIVQDTNQIVQDTNQQKSYSFILSNGKELKAIYEENDGVRKFKNLTGDNENLDFNINPNASGIVIYDAMAQNIIFMNSDGVTSKISKNTYLASDGSEFTKESTLKNNPKYVWAINPKFVDNENIAYVSQLPWFNQGDTKYLWIVNIKDPNNSILVQQISGVNIVLDKLEHKGLNILIDGKLKFLKANGELVTE